MLAALCASALAFALLAQDTGAPARSNLKGVGGSPAGANPVGATGSISASGQAGGRANPARRKTRRPDVIFVPTPHETVEVMLRQAELKKGDVLFDMGSGDGRIPIAAARLYGVRAVGIDIDPDMVALARESAAREGVSDLVTFRNEDMFLADLQGATVVTLYLSERLNLLLRPKLLRELGPGTRVVSHDFTMGDWKPERVVRVPWKSLYRTVYVWTVPRGGRIPR